MKALKLANPQMLVASTAPGPSPAGWTSRRTGGAPISVLVSGTPIPRSPAIPADAPEASQTGANRVPSRIVSPSTGPTAIPA